MVDSCSDNLGCRWTLIGFGGIVESSFVAEVAVQRVNEDSTKAEASEFPRSRLDIVARLDGSRIEVALEMSETTEYGKAERGSWEGMRMMGMSEWKAAPRKSPSVRAGPQVDEREKVGWIAIEQGIHTLLGSTGWSHRALNLKMMYTTTDQRGSTILSC